MVGMHSRAVDASGGGIVPLVLSLGADSTNSSLEAGVVIAVAADALDVDAADVIDFDVAVTIIPNGCWSRWCSFVILC